MHKRDRKKSRKTDCEGCTLGGNTSSHDYTKQAILISLMICRKKSYIAMHFLWIQMTDRDDRLLQEQLDSYAHGRMQK